MMTIETKNIVAGRRERPATIPVWDSIVRLFHWTLVASISYEFLFVAGTRSHNSVGYLILVLVVFRVIWGFSGSYYARFGEFVKAPSVTLSYLIDIGRGTPRRYIGHNPAGAAMVIVLLLMVSATALTGWALRTDALWGERWIEILHEYLAYATLVFIAAHVCGVVVASFQHRENLTKAMITGRKDKH
jgi:cytochrome b